MVTSIEMVSSVVEKSRIETLDQFVFTDWREIQIGFYRYASVEF